MKKDDYRSDFEEDRQKINLDDEPKEIKTRAELYSKNRKSKKKSRHIMINITFTLFTLIPVVIIAFFLINWYMDTNKNTTAAQDPLVKYETRANKENNNNNQASIEDKKDNEKIVEKPKKEEESIKDQPKLEKKPDKKVEVKQPEKVESKEKQEEKQKDKVETEKQPEKKVEEKPEAKTHTVSPGETLYSISVIHYQSGKGVERIKQANGITSNEIYVGQVLVIP